MVRGMGRQKARVGNRKRTAKKILNVSVVFLLDVFDVLDIEFGFSIFPSRLGRHSHIGISFRNTDVAYKASSKLRGNNDRCWQASVQQSTIILDSMGTST